MATKYGFSTNETIKHLVEYLIHSLDDSFEIFVEPIINGDQLHIVILRKNAGIYLLQVKQAHVDNYYMDETWVEKNTLKSFQSPIRQMTNFKNNFFMYHIPSIYERLVLDDHLYGIVRCGLYFEKTTTSYSANALKKDKNYTKYIDVFGYNCIDRGQIVNVILKRLAYPKQKILFTEDIYWSVKEVLLNKKTVTNPIEKLQNKNALAIVHSSKDKLKIRSTSPQILYMTLVNKLMNNTPQKTLILTYSMTLAAYIRSLIPQELAHQVLVIHMHQFLAAQQNNFNILYDIELDQYWDELTNNKKYLQLYETIIFTEADKYSQKIQKHISQYFLRTDGNIYYFQHDDCEQKLKTIISGKWSRLEGEDNHSKNITYLNKENQLIDVLDIKDFLLDKEISWEETVILCSQKSYLRFIEEQLRGKLGMFADITFANTMEWELIKKKTLNIGFGLEIQKLERNKKFHFGYDQNKIQLNTLSSHSSFYKKIVVCIVTDKDKDENFNMLLNSKDIQPQNILFLVLGRK